MFLPTTTQEAAAMGWTSLDIILVTGDAYIDSPYIGVAVIGNVLVDAGYRVGIIAQPDMDSGRDISRLGEPALFWGVTGGSVDSLVANYTALKKKRRQDDFTPGGSNTRRPDRAVIVYCNLIRRHFRDTAPIVLGGIEASLRRCAHYDFWSDSIRRSLLLDARADFLVYGMGEKTAVQLAGHLKGGRNPTRIPGLCYLSAKPPAGHIELPAYQAVLNDNEAFATMHRLLYRHTNPITAQGVYQAYGSRYLIQNRPAPYCTQQELDRIHALDYERAVHPFYLKQGNVRAVDTIRFSIPTHRGCYGECSFCAISVHQGSTVRWRSEASILAETKTISAYPDFKGYILDAGGPTANMYGFECTRKLKKGPCKNKRCLFPVVCPSLGVNHDRQLQLLKKMRAIGPVKKVFVASGIRHDLILADRKHGNAYLKAIVEHHISGQLKVAPEHSEPPVLALMAKPPAETLVEFINRFNKANQMSGKKQFLTYYLMAAHPGCTHHHMTELKKFVTRALKMNPEQVQIFTPTPSTLSTLMYCTERDPVSGKKIFVEKDPRRKDRQKAVLFPGAKRSRSSRS
jgi:uncharacterized radical SAM protein YgiQ